jgi:hypothetical protein
MKDLLDLDNLKLILKKTEFKEQFMITMKSKDRIKKMMKQKIGLEKKSCRKKLIELREINLLTKIS